MTQERFLERLGRQAEEERERIAAAAAEEVRLIRDEAEARAGKVRRDVLREASRQAAGLRSRILNEGRLEAAKIRLAARHSVVEEILRRLAEKIRALEGDESKDLLRECASKEGATVLCRAADREKVTSAAGEMGCAGVRVDDSIRLGGVTVASADGRFEERNTMEERLARARPSLVQEINRALFLAPDEGRSERRGR